MPPDKVDFDLDPIEKAFSSCAENRKRGAYAKELVAVGLREYREHFFRPYRTIYRITNENVCVLVVANSRRNMQISPQRRLLEA